MRFRVASVWIAVLSLLWSAQAGAPPPLGAFPDGLVPDLAGGTAPQNTGIHIFGDPVPGVADFGVAVSVNDAIVASTVSVVGCCLVEVDADYAAGDDVEVLVTSAGGEIDAFFFVGDTDDVAPPTVTSTQLLDDSAGLVIGVVANDASGPTYSVARVDGDIVSAATDNRVLVVAGAACADVSAVDAAGNESAAVRVCAAEGEGEGEEGEGEEGEGEGDVDDGGCAGCGGAGVGSFVVLVGLLRRRKQ